MKLFLLNLASIISFFWLIFPKFMRLFIIKSLLILESRHKNLKYSLSNIFEIKSFIDKIINERAMKYENNVHPKHRLIDYHNFFIKNINNNYSVLDLGCGYGAVAKSIALNCKNSKVVGIDNNHERLNQAIKSNNFKNLSFIYGDIESDLDGKNFDVVILSNVLEHMNDRAKLLKFININIEPKKLLIRVPMYERDWMVPFMDELEINYFLDDDHKIEHKITDFNDEINKAGFMISSMNTIWGEIWAVCERK